MSETAAAHTIINVGGRGAPATGPTAPGATPAAGAKPAPTPTAPAAAPATTTAARGGNDGAPAQTAAKPSGGGSGASPWSKMSPGIRFVVIFVPLATVLVLTGFLIWCFLKGPCRSARLGFVESVAKVPTGTGDAKIKTTATTKETTDTTADRKASGTTGSTTASTEMVTTATDGGKTVVSKVTQKNATGGTVTIEDSETGDVSGGSQSVSVGLTTTDISGDSGAKISLGTLQNSAGNTLVFADGQRFRVTAEPDNATGTLRVCQGTSCKDTDLTWEDLYKANEAIAKTSKDAADVRGRCMLLQTINDKLDRVLPQPPECAKAGAELPSQFVGVQHFDNPEEEKLSKSFYLTQNQTVHRTNDGKFAACCESGQTPSLSTCNELAPLASFQSSPFKCGPGRDLTQLQFSSSGATLESHQPLQTPASTTSN